MEEDFREIYEFMYVTEDIRLIFIDNKIEIINHFLL